MQTTTSPQQNRTLFNGFPRITDVPKPLQQFFAFLRKKHDSIKVDLKQVGNTVLITITYTKQYSLTWPDVFNNIPNTIYSLKHFEHMAYNHTQIKLINKYK